MATTLTITLLNPHADDFIRRPLSFWLARRRGLTKYSYLLDGPSLLGRRTDILIDGTISSLIGQTTFNRLPRWFRLLFLKIEISIWLRLNHMADQVNVHWSADTIADRSVLYLFSYKSCVGAFEMRRPILEQFRTKVVNMSHYFIRTGEKAKNIQSLTGVIYATESDLRQNSYFLNYFPADAKLIVLPFAVNERFVCKKPVAERASKCAATGSFHNLTEETPHAYYQEYLNFFRTDTYHPVRKLLHERQLDFSKLIDVRVSRYREKSRNAGLLAKLAMMFGYDAAQTEYFSFDIVDFYNDHQLAIIGEEAAGLPTVGFFEAMASGCVVLGQRGHFYDLLGLEPGVHYLKHDGTFESIKSTIETALKDVPRLETMSRKGLEYVATHCRGPVLWQTLEKMLAASVASN